MLLPRLRGVAPFRKPLTVDQIENAMPGLRPLKPHGENEQLSSQTPKETNSKPGQKPKLAANDQAPKFVKTDKPYKLSDGGGLYLEVDPSGGKYW
jgi:hypothetical protein